MQELADWLSRNQPVCVVTGAGCSTGSGIGDYRDARGDWKRARPVMYADYRAKPTTRRRYWLRSMYGWPHFSRARPNAAHDALAGLAHCGLVDGLVTQNVDGLHQRAGHADVVELHGTIRRVRCLDCGEGMDRSWVQDWLEARNASYLGRRAGVAPDGDADVVFDGALDDFLEPSCRRCRGTVIPTVVFYGDSVPSAVTARANDCVDRASAMLVVGSSLMVFSSFRLVRRAVAAGKPVAAVNLGVTRADDLYELKVEGDCVEALPQLADRLRVPF